MQRKLWIYIGIEALIILIFVLAFFKTGNNSSHHDAEKLIWLIALFALMQLAFAAFRLFKSRSKES
ncbi:MAG TPA: hypothetical protein VEC36_03885 [Patescibacteria group bacterium]|nr:hypothetical protein [Patescibacteria group bacterium]